MATQFDAPSQLPAGPGGLDGASPFARASPAAQTE
jgi:hypothetical protein